MDYSLLRQVLIGVVCNLLIVDSGFHEGWSTPMIPKLEHDDTLAKVTSEQGAWIINLMYVGVGVGSVIPLLLMDRIGRKWTLLIAAIPKISSWIIFACAQDYAAFYVGRLIAGIGTGVTYCVTPMYLGEISTKRTRGPLSASLAVWINIGMLIIYAIGLWTSRLVMSLIAVTVPLMFLLSFMWLPKSAIFLAKKNRLGKAERVLKWSLGRDNVDEELEEIKRIVSCEESEKITFWNSLTESVMRVESRKAFGITGILMSAMIFSGAAPILAYQSYTFEEAGFGVSTEISVLASGLAIVVSGFACVVLVKRTGKRMLLLIAAPATVLSLSVVASFFTLKTWEVDVSGIKWVPTLFIMTYALAYGLALNPLPLSYISEIFPMDVKVPAALYCSLFYATGSLLVVEIYQVLYIIIIIRLIFLLRFSQI
ncbi:PREDICTED: facilitated trehalose transporter Tret1-2 homolog isoform X2 [Ceratosolen solmsi marchali]|uniref:Facilitated trehalose transporter Tret1-2 homolog isoform X2 n=1 Tax=Ceratosolen solmsi marchali TaxID=326594 RepID=A0AAJ6VN20_9HYME|nr:PREDICTED: facilitated trehalose transporter Tret1-2 homolog isoform X2 [Ceratosolen solmsi marchali]